MTRYRIVGVLAAAALLSAGLVSVNLGSPSPAKAATQASFYVSPSGSDSNPGTLTQPFQTISRAQIAVRAIDSSMTGDIDVYLRGGIYPLSSSLSFTPADSGTNGFHVQYSAYASEQPVLSGGEPISGWTTVSGSLLWQAAVPSGLSNFRELWVNGNRATWTTSPYYTSVGGLYAGDGNANGFVINATGLDSLPNQSSMEFLYNNSWRSTRVPVTSITAGSVSGTENVYVNETLLGRAIHNDATGIVPSPSNNPSFRIQNLGQSQLSSPGQWYLDQAANKVYYYPRSTDNISTLQAYAPLTHSYNDGSDSDTDSLIHIAGASMSSKVQNLGFSGLTLSYTAWTRALSQGSTATQADAYSTANGNGSFTDATVLPSAAVDIQLADGVTFANNRLQHLGAAGIIMRNGVNNSTISGNTISDVAATAIIASAMKQDYVDSSTTGVNTNDVIFNNSIDSVGYEYFSSAGISAYYNNGLVIEHNSISNVPWAGITYGWDGWQGGQRDSTTSRNGYIGDNRIDQYTQVLGDTAGIYTLGQQPNTEVTRNYITNGQSYAAALYFDEGSANIYVHDNVLVPTAPQSNRWLYIWNSSIHDIDLNNNYTTSSAELNSGTRTADRNTQVISTPYPTAAQNIINAAGTTAGSYSAPKTVVVGDVAYGANASFVTSAGATDFGTPATPAQMAVAGIAGQYAQASSSNPYAALLVDLLTPQAVNQVSVALSSTGTYSFYVQTSNNGSNWHTASTVSGAAGGSTSTSTFPALEARYIKIVPISASPQLAVSSLQAFTGSAPAVSTPASVPFSAPSGLQLWLEGDTGVVTNSSNFVSSWQDQSGNGNNAAVPSVAYTTLDPTDNNYSNRSKEPQIDPFALNNRTTVKFDGFDDGLQAPGVSGTFNTFTVSLVVRPSVATGITLAAGTGNGSSTGAGQFLLQADPAGSGGISVTTAGSGGITPAETGNIVVPGEWEILTFTFDGSRGNLYKNGSLVASEPMSPPSSNWSGFDLSSNVDFRNKGTSAVMAGDVAELQVYNTALSTNTLSTVDAYLNAKYGSLLPDTGHLLMNLDSSRGITTSGGAVSNWADQSGSANDESQSVSADQPAVTANAFYGRPAITFNGSSTFMNSSGVAGPAMSKFTVAFNFRPQSLCGEVFRATGGWGQFSENGDCNGGIYIGTSVASRLTPANTGENVLAVNTWVQLVYVYDGTKGYLYQDGSLIASATLSQPQSWTGFQVGEAGSGTINGDVTDVLVYDSALNDQSVNAVQQYLTRTSLPETGALQLQLSSDSGVSTTGSSVSAWNDLSGNAHNASSAGSGNPTFVSSDYNGRPGISFDGSTTYMSASGVSGAFPSFTVAWNYKPASLCGQSIHPHGNWGQFSENADCAGGLYIGTSVASRITPTQTGESVLSVGSWVQLIYVYTGGVGYLYKNGSLIASLPLAAGASWTSGFELGEAGTGTINGDVTDLLVYNSGLNSDEVAGVEAYLSRASTTNSTVAPTSELALSSSAGVTRSGSSVSSWADQSGYGNNVVSAGSNQPTYSANVFNGRPVVTFDGSTTYMSSTSVVGPQNGAFSIAYNFRPQSLCGEVFRAVGGWGQFSENGDCSGGMYIGTDTSTRFTPSDTGESVLATNTWVQIIYTFDGTTARLYKNGALIATKSQSAPAAWTGFQLGESGSGTINGDVTDVEIYTTALTQGQVSSVEAYLAR